MKLFLFSILIIVLCIPACRQRQAQLKPVKEDTNGTRKQTELNDPVPGVPSSSVADAATIFSRKEIPVLCYHQIRNWRPTDSKNAKTYITPVETFRAHLKLLADSGYHTILPDELYNYLAYGTPLPGKPVMLTFDDTDDDQFFIAAPEMKKYNFHGVFFIMTVSLNRPNYMTSDQVKQLFDEGNVIGAHTWDHHSVKQYRTEQDWITQIDAPVKKLESITGKLPGYFAYPFGLWDTVAVSELKKRGFKAAYILSTKRDPRQPLYTIRRIIASGYWDARGMYNAMIRSFD